MQLQSNLDNKRRRKTLKCDTCDLNFASLSEYKKHKHVHMVANERFQCDNCEKEFDEGWKLKAHVKNHKKFECHQCVKTFQHSDTMKKHVDISHNNVKLYCHYFNDRRPCPNEEKCVFSA